MRQQEPQSPVILIVDDTPANLSMLFDLLGDENYKVLIAEDGESALEQAIKRPPDLILLDIIMPGMDGFSACEALKNNSRTCEIPIIFMSALSETEKKLNGFQLGAVDYITKPFQNEEVLARIRTHLQIQQLQKQLKESEQRLSQIISETKDAIVTVDAEANIQMFNHAAEKIFVCQAGSVLGKSFKPFLSEALWYLFTNYQQASSAPKAAIWIPEGHCAIRRTSQTFTVEATISSAEVTEQTLYTFILRDVEARQKAEAENQKLRYVNQYLQQEVQSSLEIDGLVGASDGLLEVMNSVRQVAETDATILVTGETGTGKEVVAQALHNLSLREQHPLIKLNCAAIPENLVESELFGHEKGAFTGALARKIGRFELADQGTLFLDEIGEMPLEVQTKLLRILQEGEFERIGGTTTIKVDVRIVAATHRDLPKSVKNGRFREDLFYRLNVFPIHIPPLRERKADIGILAEHFLKQYANKFNKQVRNIPLYVVNMLIGYHWPGNIRELQHLIERAVILSTGSTLAFGDWFQPVDDNIAFDSSMTLEEVEYQHIIKVLDTTHWKISGKKGAAVQLGINASTLRSRMTKLGVQRNS